MEAFPLGGYPGDQSVPQATPGTNSLPSTHPVVVIETTTAMIRDAVATPDALDPEALATALADRDVAIRSLGRALGPRPPRLIVQRLERVLVEDRAIVSTLQAHLDEVRTELGALSRRRTAAAAYAAAGRPGRANRR